MQWRIIFGFFSVAAIAGIIFLWNRFTKFGIVKKLANGKKWKSALIALIPIAIFGLFMLISLINTVIVMVHMSIVWLFAELIALVIRKIKNNKDKYIEKKEIKTKYKPYMVGIIVLCIEICYFTTGWFLAHHVTETDYHVTTSKNVGTEGLRVALIADSHVGATFDADGFKKHLEKIEAAKPDILVIAGDFVDDGTTREDMLNACEALGEFQCPYGKYFVYGNHDKGYYAKKNFTSTELYWALYRADVTVLQDRAVLVDDRFYVVGRRDRSEQDHKNMSELMKDLDTDKYVIVVDHQPTDYEAEAAAGCDLVLSGHTHGGQMIEMKLAAYLMKANDRIYGLEKRDNTTFIVTSGIGDWEIDFKTGTKAEFCIIDIENQ